MNKLNDGIVYTNSKCIGCQHCFAVCPVPGANIFFDNGVTKHVGVDNAKCVHCGNCIDACSSGAREYRDDTDEFLEALAAGEHFSVIVSSEFITSGSEQAVRIINYLMTRGVDRVYSSGTGTGIAVWAMSNYLQNSAQTNLISSSCPVMVNYFAKCSPILFKALAPIHSPSACTAIYARKYLGETNRIVCISACLAMKDEMRFPGVEGNIDLSVTARHLLERMSCVNMSEYSADLPEFACDPGPLLPQGVPGALKGTLDLFLNDRYSVLIAPAASAIKWRRNYYENMFKGCPDGTGSSFIIEMMMCQDGCIEGPAAGETRYDAAGHIQSYQRMRRMSQRMPKNNPYDRELLRSERMRLLNERYNKLSLEDFTRKLEDVYQQPLDVPDYVLDEVFSVMHKNTTEQRNINCGACGYISCREMAMAVACGYNHPTNCAIYAKYENERLTMTDPRSGVANTSAYMRRVQELLASGDAAKYSSVALRTADWALMVERFGFNRACEAVFRYARAMKEQLCDDELIATQSEIRYYVLIRKERLNSFIMNAHNRQVRLEEYDSTVKINVDVEIGVYNLLGTEESVGDILNYMHTLTDTMKDTRNRIIYYDDSIRREIVRSLEISRRIPDAIAEHEFVPYFQPKVNVETLRLEGAEALIRWKSDMGIIQPSEFIPVCEKTGLVTELDFYMLECVCCALRGWLDARITPVPISTNFSKINFRSRGVADRIIQTIDRWNVPHELVIIEYTETAYIEESDCLKETLERLVNCGVQVSMDDFGSGYASLSLLQSLPCSVLKLDGSLITTASSSQKSRMVLKSIITMACDMGITLVAEGVEQRSDYELLRELGCDTIQGFFFDKPLPQSEFEAKMRSPQYEK